LAGKLRRNLKDARLRCGDIYKVRQENKRSNTPTRSIRMATALGATSTT
jgi:hypothetical protein